MSVAGFAAHVATTRLRRQDLDFVVVPTSRAVQANFDLEKTEYPHAVNKTMVPKQFGDQTQTVLGPQTVYNDASHCKLARISIQIIF